MKHLIKHTLHYENGNLAYEGELKDNKPHGQGKFYYENGNLKYDGEWKDGAPLSRD